MRYRQRGSVDYAALLTEIAPDLDPQILEAHRRPSATRIKVTLQVADPQGEEGVEAEQTVAAQEDHPPSRAKRRRRQAPEPALETRDATDSAAQEGDSIFGYF
ncbi:hypothetical protein [Thiocystis violascens]|uniref:hypothetical protein n=1 Tax=Thiocystis violascens TaxID=73141 RepID=UPI0002D3ED73|nr:hypothetical protein [Thiocystis violascens]